MTLGIVGSEDPKHTALRQAIEEELNSELGNSAWCSTGLQTWGHPPNWKDGRLYSVTGPSGGCFQSLEDLNYGKSKYIGYMNMKSYRFSLREGSQARLQTFESGIPRLRVPCGQSSPVEVIGAEAIGGRNGLYRLQTRLENVSVDVGIALAKTRCDFLFPSAGDGVTVVRRINGKPIHVLAVNIPADSADGIIEEELARLLKKELDEADHDQREMIRRQ